MRRYTPTGSRDLAMPEALVATSWTGEPYLLAAHPRVSRLAAADVGAGPAVHDVARSRVPCDERVGAPAAQENVGSGPVEYEVVDGTAHGPVVPGAAEHQVRASTSADDVIAAATAQLLRPGRPGAGLGPVRAEDQRSPLEPEGARHEAQRRELDHVGGRGIRVDQRDPARAAAAVGVIVVEADQLERLEARARVDRHHAVEAAAERGELVRAVGGRRPGVPDARPGIEEILLAQ